MRTNIFVSKIFIWLNYLGFLMIHSYRSDQYFLLKIKISREKHEIIRIR
jgi:hypothetical protein